MADLKIKITAMLDETLSKTQLQTQLNKIAKDLKVNVGIDTQQLKELDSAVKKIQNQLGNKKVSVIDNGDINKAKELYTSVDKAVEHYKQFGQVKVNKIFDTVTKELQGFNLEVQRTDGWVDKLKFKLASLKGIHGIDNGFSLASQTSSDKNVLGVQQALSQAAQNRAKEERKLAEEQAKAINKSIEDEQKAIQKKKEESEEIKHQISLLQQKAQIEARNLTRRYGKSVDTTALNNQLATVMNINPASFASLKEYRKWQDQVSLGFKDIASNARTSSSHVLTLGEAFKTAMTRFPIWMAASTAFFQSFNFLKDGISYINELNKALTEVSIVTGMNQQQVAKLGDEYNKLAQSMGVTTVELSKAAASLYRQGLTTPDEVTQRMKTIIEYAKISSLDISTATEIMTASINSMGVSAERAADVWSYLGDATATGKHMCPLLQ